MRLATNVAVANKSNSRKIPHTGKPRKQLGEGLVASPPQLKGVDDMGLDEMFNCFLEFIVLMTAGLAATFIIAAILTIIFR